MSSSAPHRNTSIRPPAYQWYVNDARSDRAFQRMSYAQRGMYREMLDEQWDNQGIGLPDCPRACAELLGGTEEEWIANWPALRRKFVDRRSRPRNGAPDYHDPSDHDPARRIINLRLEKQRKSQREFINRQRDAGSRGGRAKAAKQKDLQPSEPIGSLENSVGSLESATPNPSEPLAPAVAKSSSSLHSTATASALALHSTAPLASAAEARSKRPVFKGQRLTVFEFMLDDLRRMLGGNFEAFDVHEWFYALDAKAVQSSVVIPQRDGGKWLQEQTLVEAHRRGLPIASTQLGSGKTAGNAANLSRFVSKAVSV